MCLETKIHIEEVMNMKTFDIECSCSRKELREWCEEAWNSKIRGDLIIRQSLLFCYCCLSFMDQRALLGSSHPRDRIQGIQQFCDVNRVISAESLFMVLLELAFSIEMQGFSVLFPTLEVDQKLCYISEDVLDKNRINGPVNMSLKNKVKKSQMKLFICNKALVDRRNRQEIIVLELQSKLNKASKRIEHLEGLMNGYRLALPKKSADILTSTLYVRLSSDDFDDPILT